LHGNGSPAWRRRTIPLAPGADAQTREPSGCQASDTPEGTSLSGSAEPVSERVHGVVHQGAFGADERPSADARENAAGRTRLEACAKAAADDAFLNPDLAALQLSVGG